MQQKKLKEITRHGTRVSWLSNLHYKLQFARRQLPRYRHRANESLSARLSGPAMEGYGSQCVRECAHSPSSSESDAVDFLNKVLTRVAFLPFH